LMFSNSFTSSQIQHCMVLKARQARFNKKLKWDSFWKYFYHVILKGMSC
jgi:hypothetical protein